MIELFEILDIVNGKDRVIATATRQDVYQKKLMHRVVHVLIFNNKGELALQLRSAEKDYCPGHWSTSVGGHVKSGETYKQAAIREMAEEVGIKVPVKPLFKGIYIDENNIKKFLYFFQAIYEGPFQINNEDADDLKFFSIAKIKKMIKAGAKFDPQVLYLLEKTFS